MRLCSRIENILPGDRERRKKQISEGAMRRKEEKKRVGKTDSRD